VFRCLRTTFLPERVSANSRPILALAFSMNYRKRPCLISDVAQAATRWISRQADASPSSVWISRNVCLRRAAPARELGLSDKVQFVTEWQRPVDAIISTDAFEHFDDPESVLRRRLIKDDGVVIVEFGPTWLHPLGGHLFSVFPWAHLIFTERVLIRWRSDFKSDGATRFGEAAGGLNRMTIARWERLVAGRGFSLSRNELVPIRAARLLHNRLTREWFTAIVRARLVPSK
jgi:hypothetical protein